MSSSRDFDGMLVIRPPKVMGESAQGYLVRLVEANALGTPNVLTPELRVQHLREPSGSKLLRGPVARTSGTSLPDAGGIPLRYWNTRRPRFCPECLKERVTWPALWQMVFYVACHRHQVVLLDRCTSCDVASTWSRGTLFQCACGTDFKGAPAEPASTAALKCSERIAAAWGDGSDIPPVDAGGTVVEGVLRRTWLLGAFRASLCNRPQKLANLHDIAVAMLIVDAAEDVLDEWPGRFIEFLADVANRYQAPDSSRLTGRFGSLYKEIFNERWKHAFADLRSGFESYVSERWTGQLAARNKRLNVAVVDAHVWVPLTRAAKELGLGLRKLRGAIDRGEARGRLLTRPSGRVTGVIHRDDIAKLREVMSSTVDLKEVCRSLRIGKKKVRQLVSNGTLVATGGPGINGGSVWQITRESRDALLAELGAQSSEASRLVGDTEMLNGHRIGGE